MLRQPRVRPHPRSAPCPPPRCPPPRYPSSAPRRRFAQRTASLRPFASAEDAIAAAQRVWWNEARRPLRPALFCSAPARAARSPSLPPERPPPPSPRRAPRAGGRPRLAGGVRSAPAHRRRLLAARQVRKHRHLVRAQSQTLLRHPHPPPFGPARRDGGPFSLAPHLPTLPPGARASRAPPARALTRRCCGRGGPSPWPRGPAARGGAPPRRGAVRGPDRTWRTGTPGSRLSLGTSSSSAPPDVRRTTSWPRSRRAPLPAHSGNLPEIFRPSFQPTALSAAGTLSGASARGAGVRRP